MCVNLDKTAESLTTDNIYVPRDEYFSEVKMENHTDTTKGGKTQAFVPGMENFIIGKELGFPYFTAIDELFNEDDDLSEKFQEKLKNVFLAIINFLPSWGKKVLRFRTPSVLDSKILTIFTYFAEHIKFILMIGYVICPIGMQEINSSG